jgi:hypothetical protein
VPFLWQAGAKKVEQYITGAITIMTSISIGYCSFVVNCYMIAQYACVMCTDLYRMILFACVFLFHAVSKVRNLENSRYIFSFKLGAVSNNDSYLTPNVQQKFIIVTEYYKVELSCKI